jgi:hypothetical protein
MEVRSRNSDFRQQHESLQTLASECDKLQSRVEQAEKERDELVELTIALTAELDLDQLKQANPQEPPQHLPDLEAARDRILKGLTIGKN